MQYAEEWDIYRSVTTYCLSVLPAHVLWLDMRGNHDSFDVDVKSGH